VLSIFLFSRGEKSTELVFIEEASLRDMQQLSMNELRDKIYSELKRA